MTPFKIFSSLPFCYDSARSDFKKILTPLCFICVPICGVQTLFFVDFTKESLSHHARHVLFFFFFFSNDITVVFVTFIIE